MLANFKVCLQSMLGCSRDRYFVYTGNDAGVGPFEHPCTASSKAAALADYEEARCSGKAQGSTKFQRLQGNT